MKTRAKRLPRLWCALQGLLPLEGGLVAQRGALAWPVHTAETLAARKMEESPAGAGKSPTPRAVR